MLFQNPKRISCIATVEQAKKFLFIQLIQLKTHQRETQHIIYPVNIFLPLFDELPNAHNTLFRGR